MILCIEKLKVWNKDQEKYQEGSFRWPIQTTPTIETSWKWLLVEDLTTWKTRVLKVGITHYHWIIQQSFQLMCPSGPKLEIFFTSIISKFSLKNW